MGTKRKYDRGEVVQLYKMHKVLTKKELIKNLGCSTMTLWRLLSDIGYLTSYNLNASYYTLREIPCFDKSGLWIHREVRFSRYGSLTETICQLVYISEAGLSAHDIHVLVGTTVLPLLKQLFTSKKIFRQKIASSFVYYHIEEFKRKLQIGNRQRKSQQDLERVILPDPGHIIAVLVELIKNSELGASQIANRLRRRGYLLTEQEITQIFVHYKLAEKKT